MTLLIDIITSILNGTLLYLFYKIIFSEKRGQLPSYMTISIFIFSEILYYFLSINFFNEVSIISSVVRCTITLSINFALSYFFQSKIHFRLLVSVLYLALITICEDLSFCLITKLLYTNITIDSLNYAMISCISTLSSFFLFILTIALQLFWKKENVLRSKKYISLLLITPTLSICLILSKPIFSLTFSEPKTYTLLVSFILFINIVNYILLHSLIRSESMEAELKILNEQIFFQKNKYQQLSEAYKNIRSFIHDTKKHLFYIENCVNEEKYDLIIPYTKSTMVDLESRYCKINTGNLVIDSFVSNIVLQAEKHGIEFTSTLKFDNTTIPLDDYHMTIILGNLLDNALNACLNQNTGTIHLAIQTIERTFTIHITNTFIPSKDTPKHKNYDEFDFIHGYGLKNVKEAAKAYDGFCIIDCVKNLYSVTVILPIN